MQRVRMVPGGRNAFGRSTGCVLEACHVLRPFHRRPNLFASLSTANNDKVASIPPPPPRLTLEEPSHSLRNAHFHTDTDCTSFPFDLLPPRRNKRMQTLFSNFVEEMKQLRREACEIPRQNPDTVFVNYKMETKDVHVFGFDYDYTLASYTEHVETLIYDLAKRELLEKGYPAQLAELKYDPRFAIRGLHYDMERGNVLKIDFLGHIQTCFFGRTPLSADMISSMYDNRTILRSQMLRSMHDIFCMPEVCLLSDTIQHFVDHNIRFSPASVYDDVSRSVADLHRSGVLHSHILKDLPLYLDRAPGKRALLEKLKRGGKRTFLLTNSAFPFIDAGMRYMFGDEDLDQKGGHDWAELFDLVITLANKPQFFTSRRPFRRFNTESGTVEWSEVTKLRSSCVYLHGCLEDFARLTGWPSSSILYFGDHLSSDIVEANRQVGWRTGCIIPELEHEINIQNVAQWRELLARVIEIDRLISDCQREWKEEADGDEKVDEDEAINQWNRKRDEYLEILKNMYVIRSRRQYSTNHPNRHNSSFGSSFRTYNTPSSFAYTLGRYADLYTSRLENLLPLALHKNYTFMPHRSLLPHEPGLHRSFLIRHFNTTPV